MRRTTRRWITLPRFDDVLTKELERAARPADPAGVFEGLEQRRARRATARRLQGALLAIAVIGATTTGFVLLSSVFDPGKDTMSGTTSYGAEGAIVVCGDEDGGQLCRIDAQALAQGATSDDLVRLTHFSDVLVAAPAVSADGTTVVFERHRVGAETDRIETAELWTIRVDGTGLRQLTTPGSGFIDPSWSTSGLIVAVASDVASLGAGPASLVILDPSAGPASEIRRISLPGLTSPSSPQWVPRGERILFSASAESITDMFTVAVDGSHLTNITNSDETESTPRLSPDGRSIAFWVGSPNGVEIRICPLECVDPRPLSDPDGRPIYGDFPVWSPDGNWIAFQVTTGPGTDLHIARIDGSDERVLLHGVAEIAWIPASTEGTTVTPEPSPTPRPEPEGKDVGLGFNLCHTERLGGIDFLGDGTRGTAWTGTKVKPNGTCPTNYDDRFGVAVDYTGDGIADSWSGETIVYCGGCEPFKAIDLNGDGGDELIVVLQYFSIMNYGVYTVLPVDGEPHVRTFRTGPPGHPGHPDYGLEEGAAFDLWVGGDAGFANWIYCENLPELWLTATESPVDGGAGNETTVYETHVSLGTDGIAHILSYDTYTVPADVRPELRYAGPDHSQPDCGLGVNDGRP